MKSGNIGELKRNITYGNKGCRRIIVVVILKDTEENQRRTTWFLTVMTLKITPKNRFQQLVGDFLQETTSEKELENDIGFRSRDTYSN